MNNCTENNLPLKIWVIDYYLSVGIRGIAVVKAPNPKRAEEILRADGAFNGSNRYKITRIEEVLETPLEGLLSEQNILF